MSLSIPYGELEQKYEDAKAAIERVRELHKRVIVESYECSDGCCYQASVDDCLECVQSWPCDTIKALDGDE